MRRASDLCDYFFICSAASTRQARAIADGITEELKKKNVRLRPWHVEGYREGFWIILDYNLVIVHIFYKETRAFYRLERLWGDVPRVTFAKTKKKARCRKTSSKKVSPAS